MSSLVGRAKKELLMRIDATVATERQRHIDQKGPLIDFLRQNRILLHHLFAGSTQADDPKRTTTPMLEPSPDQKKSFMSKYPTR